MSLHNSEPVERPYGFWSSPIDPALLSQRVRLDDVQWSRDGQTLGWLEGRSGTGTLVAQSGQEAPRDLTVGQDVRGGVGYGGGDFILGKDSLIYAEKDGRLYRRPLDFGSPRPLTPAFGKSASPTLSPDERWILYVNSYEGRDVLALVPADGSRWPVQAASGADFYMQPAWSAEGRWVAWIEWDHPNMPWDGARLMLAGFDAQNGRVIEARQVAGGAQTPVFQPEFSPDGRWLSYLSGEGEQDVFRLRDLKTGAEINLMTGQGMLPPAWIQGMRAYDWGRDGREIFIVKNERGFAELWRVPAGEGQAERISIDPYTWIRQLSAAPDGERLAFVASAAGLPDRVVVLDNGRSQVRRYSLAEMAAPDEYSNPRPLEWNAPDGTTVYGIFYPPANPRFTSAGLPPAIVHIHGGPTSQDVANFDPEIGFFTSRGFAYLAVNYRGSCGYGWSYTRLLNGCWGDLDVEDAMGGARALVEQGLADPRRLVIEGKSAGGYTVLNALIRSPGTFKAGISSYGVTNLFSLAADTHKFEERYLDGLVGLLPDRAERYRDWSPLFHAGQIQDPVAIFQGDEDNVVPPAQAETLVAALRERGVPHIYRLYAGEGHGFRKSETLATYYQDMERFLQQYVLYGS